jgi:outer membrane immunogenic protein
MHLKLGSLLAAAISIAVVQNASAADLPTKGPIYKAPPAPVFDWTGFYLGGYVGVAASQSRSLDPIGSQFGDGTLQHTGYGFTGGGTIGYNWQLGNALFGNKWVVGLEGDIGYFGAGHRTVDFDDSGLTYDDKTSWLATVRGRIGWADGPNFSYITGGYAALNLKDTNFDSSTGFEVSSSKTKGGYAIGTGTETMLGGGWSAKAESLYIDVGSGDTLVNPSSGFIVQTDKHKYQTQRFGLNYLFGAKTGPLPQTNWNGLYLGMVAGTALASARADDASPGATGQIGNNGTGFFVGGQAGYNWMLGPRIVVGVEGDFSYFNINQVSADYYNLLSPYTALYKIDTSWIATARGRIGYSTGPALIYATGGGAWVNMTDSLTTNADMVSSSKTMGGWTIGGGIETTLWRNWSMKSEYLFVSVGRNNTLASTGGYTISPDHDFHLFRTGLVYRFGGNPLSGL